jgi:hypothetical protein
MGNREAVTVMVSSLGCAQRDPEPDKSTNVRSMVDKKLGLARVWIKVV